MCPEGDFTAFTQRTFSRCSAINAVSAITIYVFVTLGIIHRYGGHFLKAYEKAFVSICKNSQKTFCKRGSKERFSLQNAVT